MKKNTFNRICAAILAIVTVFLLIPVGMLPTFAETPKIWDGTAAAGFAGGTGSEAKPYLIGTAEQLVFFAEQVNNGYSFAGKFVKLTNDILLNDTTNWEQWETSAPKNHWTAIGNYYDCKNYYFAGTFDGDGHIVSGIYINTTSDYQGLFGFAHGATIQNLGVEKSFIKGSNYVGGVVGENYNYGTVTNCYNTGEVSGTGNYVGGVVGANYGTVTNCHNTGTVSGGSEVGGVVGVNYGTVTNCYNTGEVSGTGNYVGGVVGNNYGDVTVTNCYNTGNVTGNYVGGVVGFNYGTATITNCYNTGDVSGTGNYVGGVVGYNRSHGTVTNCYNTGNVTGDSVGGVVGYNYGDGTVTNCYYLTDCAKDGKGASQFGIGSTTEDISGQTTELTDVQMKKKENFVGFDFDKVWGIGLTLGYDYPTLHLYVTVVTAPTCTEMGYTTYTCECGKTYKDYTDSLGHDYEWVIDKKATKKESGLKHKECTRCHDKTDVNTVIPAMLCDHEYARFVSGEDATCTEDGLRAYWYCSECEKFFSDSEFENEITEDIDEWRVIEKLGHAYGTPTYVWNGDQCTAKRVCSHDGSHIETETVKSVYVKDTDAACEANEKGHYEATFQNGAFEQQFTEKNSVEKQGTKLGHSYGTPIYIWNGDQCTAKRVCSHDGSHIETETVTGIYVKDTDATCEENEKGHYEATFTNPAFAKQSTAKNSVEVPETKIGHSFTNYVSDGNATCTADGTKTAHCDHAGCQETDTIADPGSKLGHDYGTPTYVWNGDQCTATRVCSHDGSHIETETVTGIYVKDTDATCEENEKGHYEATFANPAFAKQSTAKNSVEVPETKLGHSFTNYVSDNNATCTADGTKTAHCDHAGCNATDTIADVGSKLGHNYDKPTYTWNGDKCTATMVCLNDSGHSETETATAKYIKDTNATCTENEKGHYEVTFQNGAFEQQFTEKNSVEKQGTKLGHNYVAVVTPPTETERGYTTHTCSHCHDSYVDSYTDPIPAVTYGDINGDGAIDAFDYQMLKAFVLGTFKDVTDEQKETMDVNHDGCADAFDYQMVKAHVLGTYVIQ